MGLNSEYSSSKLRKIASRFEIPENPSSVCSVGSGLINSSYKVETSNNESFLLQKINSGVFKRSDVLMNNFQLVTEYLQQNAHSGKLKFPHIVKTRDGNIYLLKNSECWRMMTFIEPSISIQHVKNADTASQIGFALAEFHQRMKDFEPGKLQQAIPDFHNVAKRINDFVASIEYNITGRLENIRQEINALLERKDFILEIINNKVLKCPERIIHQDTKVSNFLFNEKSEIISLIDLDTVGDGYLCFDTGDALRSILNNAAEDANSEKLEFNKEYLAPFLNAYLSNTTALIDKSEIESIKYGAQIICFEQSIRFAADYLNGDIYFKTSYPTQNLMRTKNQLTLLRAIENNQGEINRIVDVFLE